jgi:hypothetical protein
VFLRQDKNAFRGDVFAAAQRFDGTLSVYSGDGFLLIRIRGGLNGLCAFAWGYKHRLAATDRSDAAPRREKKTEKGDETEKGDAADFLEQLSRGNELRPLLLAQYRSFLILLPTYLPLVGVRGHS